MHNDYQPDIDEHRKLWENVKGTVHCENVEIPWIDSRFSDSDR